MENKVKIEKGEVIRPEAKFFTMRDGCLLFKCDRMRLDGIKKKLEVAQKNRNPKQTVEKTIKEIILRGIKFAREPALNNLQVYVSEQPSVRDSVESMTEQLYDEMKFKPSSDGQTSLVQTEQPKKQGRLRKAGQ